MAVNNTPLVDEYSEFFPDNKTQPKEKSMPPSVVSPDISAQMDNMLAKPSDTISGSKGDDVLLGGSGTYDPNEARKKLNVEYVDKDFVFEEVDPIDIFGGDGGSFESWQKSQTKKPISSVDTSQPEYAHLRKPSALDDVVNWLDKTFSSKEDALAITEKQMIENYNELMGGSRMDPEENFWKQLYPDELYVSDFRRNNPNIPEDKILEKSGEAFRQMVLKQVGFERTKRNLIDMKANLKDAGKLAISAGYGVLEGGGMAIKLPLYAMKYLPAAGVFFRSEQGAGGYTADHMKAYHQLGEHYRKSEGKMANGRYSMYAPFPFISEDEYNMLNGPNGFYEIWTKLFIDSNYKMRMGEDVSVITESVYPSMLADSAIKGVDNVLDPMLSYLEIPDSEKTSLTQALSMGTGVLMPGNIFRVAAMGVKGAGIAGKLALTNIGLPTLKMANKVTDKVFNKGFFKGSTEWLEKEMKLADGVSVDPSRVGFYTAIKNDTKRNLNMAIGAGSGYGIGHWLFEKSEYEPLSIVMSLMGGMAGGLKVAQYTGAAKGARFLNRSFGLLHYLGDRLTVGAPMKVLGIPEKGGNLNAYLRFKGYTRAQVKAVEKKGRDQLDDLLRMYPDDVAYAKAASLGLVRGDNSYNTDFGKLELTFTSPAEIKFYNKMATDLKGLEKTDPQYYKDVVASAKQADRLVARIASSFSGELGDNYDAIVGSIGQIIHITHFRNLQNTLVNKLRLGLTGGWDKSKLLSDAKRMERDIDKQVIALEKQIQSMKLRDDAAQDIVEVTNKINAFLKYHINHSLNLNKPTTGVFAKISAGLKGVTKKRAEVKLAKQSEDLQINDFGVVGKNKQAAADQLRRRNEGLFFGDTTGVFTIATRESKERYTKVFDTADKQNLFLDGNPLMNPNINKDYLTVIDTLGTLNRSVSKTVLKGKDITEDMSLLEGMRRRAFNNKKTIDHKNNLNVHQTYIENLYADVFGFESLKAYMKNAGDQGYTKIRIIDELEKRLIKSTDDVVNTDIPAHMSISEWHMLRSKMGSEATRHLRSGDRASFLKYDKLHDKIDNLLDPKNPANAKVVSLLKDATEHFKTEILPFRQFMSKKIFIKDETGAYITDKLDYFALFFTQKTNLNENAKQFKKFFCKKGKCDPVAVQTLVKGLGVALEGGGSSPIAQNILNIQREFADILPAKTLDALDNLADVRAFRSRGNNFIPQDQQDALKTIAKTMEDAGDMRLKLLLKSVFGDMSNIGGQELSPAALQVLEKFKYKNEARYTRANFVDTFFNTKSYTAAKPIGLTASARADFEKEEGMVELQKIKERESVLQGKEDVDYRKGPYLTSNAREMDTYAEQARDIIQRHLPKEVDIDVAIHPFALLKEHIDTPGIFNLAQREEFMSSVKNMFLEEMLERSIKFTNTINTTGAARRAKLAAKDQLDKNIASIDNSTIALKQEIDPNEMHMFLKNNSEVFKIMYGVSQKNVEQLEEQAIKLLQKNKVNISKTDPVLNILKAEKFGNEAFKKRARDIRHVENIRLLNENAKLLHYGKGLRETVQGVPTDYSAPMILGRIYNSLKGVVSPRYVVGEGSIVKARLMRVNLLRSMLFDPAATRVIVDVFVNGVNSSQNIKKLNSIVASAAGIDLSRNEKSQLKTLADRAANEIKTLTQEDYETQTRFTKQYAPTRFNIRWSGYGKDPYYWGNEQHTGYVGVLDALNPLTKEPRVLPDFPISFLREGQTLTSRPIQSDMLREIKNKLNLDVK